MALHTDMLKLDNLTSDPVSPPDGSIWYRSDLGRFRIREGGVTKSVDATP